MMLTCTDTAAGSVVASDAAATLPVLPPQTARAGRQARPPPHQAVPRTLPPAKQPHPDVRRAAWRRPYQHR